MRPRAVASITPLQQNSHKQTSLGTLCIDATPFHFTAERMPNEVSLYLSMATIKKSWIVIFSDHDHGAHDWWYFAHFRTHCNKKKAGLLLPVYEKYKQLPRWCLCYATSNKTTDNGHLNAAIYKTLECFEAWGNCLEKILLCFTVTTSQCTKPRS